MITNFKRGIGAAENTLTKIAEAYSTNPYLTLQYVSRNHKVKEKKSCIRNQIKKSSAKA